MKVQIRRRWMNRKHVDVDGTEYGHDPVDVDAETAERLLSLSENGMPLFEKVDEADSAEKPSWRGRRTEEDPSKATE